MLTKLFVLGLALYGFWNYGIDGFRVSMQGRNPATLSVEQVMQGKLGGRRYVRLTGFTDANYVYSYDKDDKNRVQKIEYALLSAEALQAEIKAVSAGQKYSSPVRVIVGDNTIAADCNQKETCLEVGQRTVVGVVQYGFDGLSDETKSLFTGQLKSGAYKVSDDVVYIDSGGKPSSIFVPTLVMLGTGLVAAFIVLTFFQRPDPQRG